MSEDKALRRAQNKLVKALDEHRDAEAIELLTELRRYEPHNPRWPHKLGELLRQRGLNAQAAQCFEKAVTLYASQGFLARAVAMAKTVVELDPSRIGVLERIDPQAAQLLRTQKRAPRAARLDLEERAATSLPLAPPREQPQRSKGPPAHPPSLAAPPVPQAPRTPRLLELSIPPRGPVVRSSPQPPVRAAAKVSAPGRPPPPPTAARPVAPSESRRPQRAAPPPPPPEAFLAPGAAPTLDRLSLPPLGQLRMRQPDAGAPGSLDEIYARAVARVPILSPDPSSPADETRFSTQPPALQVAAGRGEAELARQLLAAAVEPGDAALKGEFAAAEDDEYLRALDCLEAEAGIEATPALSQQELRARAPVQPSVVHEPPSAAALAELPLFPLFAALPAELLSQLAAGSQLIELPHAAFAVRSGDRDDALYGIVTGSVTVSVPDQPFELTLGEGDVFGEACLLDDARSQVDVVVRGQLSALRIPREVLLQAVEQHPPLASLVLGLLTRRLLGNLLQMSPLFQDFDAAGKAELAGLFEVRRVAAGSQLSIAGKKMDGLYIALTGTLRVREPGARERSAPPGSMFGQNSLLRHDPSGVDVVAAVDMIVLRLPAARFAGMAMQYPTVLVRLAELSTGDVVRVMM